MKSFKFFTLAFLLSIGLSTICSTTDSGSFPIGRSSIGSNHDAVQRIIEKRADITRLHAQHQFSHNKNYLFSMLTVPGLIESQKLIYPQLSKKKPMVFDTGTQKFIHNCQPEIEKWLQMGLKETRKFTSTFRYLFDCARIAKNDPFLRPAEREVIEDNHGVMINIVLPDAEHLTSVLKPMLQFAKRNGYSKWQDDVEKCHDEIMEIRRQGNADQAGAG